METDIRRSAILGVVWAIPPGHVMTYGQVAEAASLPGRARLVGRILHDLPDGSDVPWHRVVNAAGTISPRDDRSVASQRQLLEAEGVILDDGGRIDLRIFALSPTARAST